ncbi:hypothetical protein SUGI_1187410 [Cryptomeria japonica]|nr:hypothetical protein SUGI_1187410 [Cryptomeria japonica]
MVPLDCLHCFVFKLDTLCSTLCSNSAFLLLVCNAIIGTLMALSKSSESPDIYTVYFKESESRRKQVGFAEASSAGKNLVHGAAEISGCREICSVEHVQQLEIEGGDCCSEEKSRLAVVAFQGDVSNEELNKKCDKFIAAFRRQMSMEHQSSAAILI